MLEEVGYVVACEAGEENQKGEPGLVWVSVERRTACESCSVQKGCGTSVLSKVVGKKIATMKVRNTLDAKVGDQVRIGINDHVMVSGSALMYLLPLTFMFLFSLIVDSFFQQELLTILSAVVGLSLGFLFIKSYANKSSHVKHNFQARMLSIETQQPLHFSAKLLS